VIEGQLASNTYVAGNDLTIADFTLLAFLDPAEMVELNLSAYPKLSIWRNALRSEAWYTAVHGFFGESAMAAE
jgi:glutathione S-transferase